MRSRGLVAVGLAVVVLVGTARAGDRARVVPENALQPPGASFEGQPEVGRAQGVAIVREALRASARATLRAPLRTAVREAGRTAERVGVRVVELSPFSALPRRLCHGGDALDLGGGDGGPQLPARLTLLPGSEPSLHALFGLIAGATARIDLMMYGWEDDPTGREVTARLADAARRGVAVRLLVDRTGVLIHNPAAAEGRATFLDALAAVPNVTLIEPPGAFFRFDHRKLALVDNRVAWTGGMILTEAARRRWNNLSVVAEGPIVDEYAALFELRWRESGGVPGPPRPPAPAAPANALVRMIRTDVGDRSLKNSIYHAVDHAREHIYLENPYFTDEILTAKLVAARRRGVDVRAVLTLRGNVARLNRYSALTANRLLRGGVRVYLYPAMTHVKAMSIDGIWTYIGTGNFDELSFRNNREVSLSVAGAEVAAAIDRTLFLPDMAASQELSALLPPPRKRLILELLSLWY